MTIRAFVLGVALVAAVGWCMVQESYKQTRARYRLAELTRKESGMRSALRRLRAEEEGLRSPARLAALIREKKMDLMALRAAFPGDADGERRGRLPGDVLDEEFARAERRTTVASATSRQ